METINDHATAVLIITPAGIPLIRDPKKSLPFWKLPGGRSNPDETAVECAIREVREEIGLNLSSDALSVIHEENRGKHILTIFRTDLPNLPELQKKGNDGEDVRVFKAAEIIALPELFPNHRKVIEKILKEL